MGLARAANLPVLVIGDIDRGGVFPSLYGTLALLEPEDQALIAGFLINKFRGDPSILDPGLDMLRNLTGRHTYGVLPWLDGPFIDAEDSLALRQDHTTAGHAGRRRDPAALDEQLHRRRRARGRAGRVASATRARRPTSSAPTSSSSPARRPPSRTSSACAPTASTGALQSARARSSASAAATRCSATGSRTGSSPPTAPTGLGLLPLNTTFAPEKLLRQVEGTVLGVARHRLRDPPRPRRPRRAADPGRATCSAPPGTACSRATKSAASCSAGWPSAPAAAGRPGTRAFQAVREAHLDRLADWFGAHVDAPAFTDLIQQGAPEGLPTIPPGGTACSVF